MRTIKNRVVSILLSVSFLSISCWLLTYHKAGNIENYKATIILSLMFVGGFLFTSFVVDLNMGSSPLPFYRLKPDSQLTFDCLSKSKTEAFFSLKNGFTLTVCGPEGFIPKGTQRGTLLVVHVNSYGRKELVIVSHPKEKKVLEKS